MGKIIEIRDYLSKVFEQALIPKGIKAFYDDMETFRGMKTDLQNIAVLRPGTGEFDHFEGPGVNEYVAEWTLIWIVSKQKSQRNATSPKNTDMLDDFITTVQEALEQSLDDEAHPFSGVPTLMSYEIGNEIDVRELPEFGEKDFKGRLLFYATFMIPYRTIINFG